MSLLFLDGFDHYGTGTNTCPALFGKWVAGSAGAAAIECASTPVRMGTGSLKFGYSGADILTKAFNPTGGMIVGFAFRTAVIPGSNINIISVREGASTDHTFVQFTTGGGLRVMLGDGGTVLATGTTTLLINTWYYIEYKTIIHDTTGSFELRVNGATEVSGTNVDTRYFGSGVWDSLRIKGVDSTSHIDDFYLCDTGGSAPRNNFLGPIKVETLFPQTDAVAVGSNTGLTPSTGTDHGALVDENPPNTTDYNGSATVGAKDTYNYPALVTPGTVLGVQTNLYTIKTDLGARQVAAVIRSGGVDADGANVSPAGSYSYLSEIRPVNTNGGAEWTTATINSSEFGMKVTV